MPHGVQQKVKKRHYSRSTAHCMISFDLKFHLLKGAHVKEHIMYKGKDIFYKAEVSWENLS